MKISRRTPFRLAAATLAMTQIFTAAASAAFTNGFSWSYPVGEGLTYTHTEGKNSAGVQRANVLTYAPNIGVSPVMVYAGDTVYGSKATIMNAVKYLQNQGKTVIGGTNADFFVMSSGVPIGLVIDKGITMADLKGTLETLIKAMYGQDSVVRFRPHHFPFTEPSCEVDVQCFNCRGKGCSTCKGEGWIELLGAGMVHPKVLAGCDIDPEIYSGFAFGIGLERMAMRRFKISDMRMIFENDIRFLSQF